MSGGQFHHEALRTRLVADNSARQGPGMCCGDQTSPSPAPAFPALPPVTARPGCSCGTSIVPLERIRIVGGEPATKHQFPWQVTSHLSHLTPEVLIVSPGGADLQTDRPALLWRLSGELHHRPDGRSLRDSPPPLQSRPGGARRDGARR